MKTSKSLKEKEYPYNLIDDIFSLTRDEFGNVLNYKYQDIFSTISDAQIKGLNHGLSSLPEKMQFCLQQRYEYKKTYKEIGIKINSTANYTREIILKGLKRLRHQSRSHFIIKGYHRNELDELNMERYFILQKYVHCMIDSEEARHATLKLATKSMLDTKLYDLLLSLLIDLRLYEILSKNNFHIIRDFYNITDEELLSIPGIDEGTINSINNLLKNYIIGKKFYIV
jgi:hypothetical protein